MNAHDIFPSDKQSSLTSVLRYGLLTYRELDMTHPDAPFCRQWELRAGKQLVGYLNDLGEQGLDLVIGGYSVYQTQRSRVLVVEERQWTVEEFTALLVQAQLLPV